MRNMKRKAVSGIVLMLLLTSMLSSAFNIQTVKADQTTESPWPMFQHDPQHTGRSPFVGPSKKPQVEILLSAAATFGSPVTGSDGTLYLGWVSSGEKWGLCAFNPDGTQKWFHEIQPAGEATPLLNPPALLESSKAVYTKTRSKIFAVNMENGSLRWKKSFAYIYDNLVVGDDEILYFTASCHLPDDSYCIRLIGLDENGEQILSYDIGETGATPSCPTIDKEGTIYFGYNDTLFAINPNGTEKWRRTFEADLEYYASSRPTVTTPSIADDGTIYVVVFRQSDWRTALDQGFNNHLHAIDPENPSIDKWCRRYRYSYGFTSPEVPPAIDFDGNVYATSSYYVPGSGSHLLILVFTPEGNLKRSMELGGGFLLIDAENTVFSLGRLTPLAASLRIFDSEGSETVVNFPHQEGSRQPFLSLASDGTLYVGGHKNLYAVRRGESPWLQFQHDAQHTGRSAFLGPGTENIEVSVLIEGKTDNDYFGSPVVGADGTLYLTAAIEGRGGLFAFNSDGTEKWFYETPYPTLMPALSKSDETVCVLSDDGILAVNTANGQLRWKKDFGGLFADQQPVIGDNGIIYFIAVVRLPDSSYDVCLIAINEYGEVIWAYAPERDETYYNLELPEEQPTGWGSSVPATMPTIDKEGTIYFGYLLRTLFAINSDGTKKWQRTIEGHITPSIADDGTVYLITAVRSDLPPYESRNGLLAIDPKNPLEDKWSHYTGGVPLGPPAIDSNGNVYLPVWYDVPALWIYTPEGNVKGFLWLAMSWSGRLSLPLIDAENNVYIHVDGTLNVLDCEGNLTSITLPTDYTEQLSRTLSLGSDGTLYIGGSNLYAVKSTVVPPPNQHPSASFTYTPPSPIVGEEITFDASLSYDLDGQIVSYKWDFGDGYTAEGITAIHAYASTGYYTVTLTVTDNDGATDSASQTIVVKRPPVLLVHGFQWHTFYDPVNVWKDMAEYLTRNDIRNARLVESHNFWKLEGRSLDDFTVYISNYADSGWTIHSIRYYAKKLAEEIETVKKDAKVDKVYVVAHSMGGLVSRAYIENEDFPDNPYGIKYKNDVRKLVMLGTPNNGITEFWKNLLKLLGLLGCDSAKDLTSSSGFLPYLNGGKTGGDLGVEYSAIAGSRDRYVTRESAFYGVPSNRRFPLPINHNELRYSEDSKKIVKEVLTTIKGPPLKGDFFISRFCSSVELRVYDSQGRVTGLVNGEVREDIPNSTYDEKTGMVVIYPAIDSYRCEVVGIDEGAYGLDIALVKAGETIAFTADDIPIVPEAIHQYTVDWVALSLGEEGVSLQIDSEGDGIFEQTVTADNELSHDEFVSAYLCMYTHVDKTFKPNEVSQRRRGSVMSWTYINNTGYLSLSEITFNDTILDGWATKDLDRTISVTLFIDGAKYQIPYDELDYVAIEDGKYIVYINFTAGVNLYQFNATSGMEEYRMTIYAFEPGWVLEIKYPMHPPKGLETGDYEATVSVTVVSPEGIAVTVDDTATLHVK